MTDKPIESDHTVEPVVVHAGGEAFTITPMNTRQTLKVLGSVFQVQRILREASATSAAFRDSLLSVRDKFDKKELTAEAFEAAAMPLIVRIEQAEEDGLHRALTEVPEAVLTIIGAAIHRDADYVGGLPPDESFSLGMAVMKVNRRFFVERVLPKLTGFLNSLRRTPETSETT